MDVAALYALDPLDAIATVEAVRAGDFRPVRRLGFIFAAADADPGRRGGPPGAGRGAGRGVLQTFDAQRKSVGMTIPARPKFQQQGPGDNCVIGGKEYGWLSPTSYSTAISIDKATLGVKAPSGCAVRRGTGDTVGGTNLPQNAAVAEKLGVKVALHVGSNVGSDKELAGTLHLGRGCVVQGGTKPLLTTKWRSTTGAINHAVYVNEVRGGTTFEPEQALVYDPAADGRRKGIDQGPSSWPWTLLVAFAGALQPWGESDPRVVEGVACTSRRSRTPSPTITRPTAGRARRRSPTGPGPRRRRRTSTPGPTRARPRSSSGSTRAPCSRR